MKRYAEINNLNGGKVEIVVYIKPATEYVLVMKHLLMRAEFSILTFDVIENKLVTYINSLGEFTLDQDETNLSAITLLTVGGVTVTDNASAYTEMSKI